MAELLCLLQSTDQAIKQLVNLVLNCPLRQTLLCSMQRTFNQMLYPEIFKLRTPSSGRSCTLLAASCAHQSKQQDCLTRCTVHCVHTRHACRRYVNWQQTATFTMCKTPWPPGRSAKTCSSPDGSCSWSANLSRKLRAGRQSCLDASHLRPKHPAISTTPHHGN